MKAGHPTRTRARDTHEPLPAAVSDALDRAAPTRYFRGARPRRVLLVAPQPFYEDRGTPIAIRQVLEALTQIGYAVDLLTFPVGRPFELPGVRLFRVSNPFGIRQVPIGFSLRKLTLDGFLIPALRRRLREEEYACVHAVEEAGFLAVLLARDLDLPVIYDMQSSLPEQLLGHALFRGRLAQSVLQRCERWLLSNADLVISSTGLAGKVRQVAPQTRVEEWSYVSNCHPVDAGEIRLLRKTLRLPRKARVVLYAGNFAKYQGVSILLSAVPAVRAVVEDAVFVLVGAERNGSRSVPSEAEVLEAQGAIRIVERQPRERIPAYLAMAEVVVSPRLQGDNLPLKIFDYLASGRPIVATDNATHRSILDEGLASLVPPCAKDMAGAVVDLLLDPQKSRRLGKAGREFAEEKLSWVNFVDSIDAIYARATR